MTTSLSVPPVTAFSRLRSLTLAARMAKRRWAVMLLFHGVGGAADIGIDTRGPSCGPASALIAAPACWAAELSPVMPAAAAKSRTMRSCTRIALAGLRTRLAMARRSSSASVGISSGSHGGLSPGGGGVRREVVHHRHHDHARRAVDRGVVVLREQRPAAVLEALDDVDLPQRAGAVHRPPDDAGDLLGELVAAPGRGQAHVADVEVEVEVGVHRSSTGGRGPSAPRRRAGASARARRPWRRSAGRRPRRGRSPRPAARRSPAR